MKSQEHTLCSSCFRGSFSTADTKMGVGAELWFFLLLAFSLHLQALIPFYLRCRRARPFSGEAPRNYPGTQGTGRVQNDPLQRELGLIFETPACLSSRGCPALLCTFIVSNPQSSHVLPWKTRKNKGTLDSKLLLLSVLCPKVLCWQHSLAGHLCSLP